MSQQTSLHIWQYFGLRSQVWLYRLLRQMKQYPPALLVRREWLAGRDLAEFPWPDDRLITFPRHPFSLRYIGKIAPAVRSFNRNALSSLDAAFIRHVCHLHDTRVIHIHFGWLASNLLAARPKLGAPVVISLYGSDVIRTTGRGTYRARLKHLLRQDYTFVVESHFLRDILVDMGCDAARVCVVPVGIDVSDAPELTTVQERLTKRAEKKTVKLITVGRLVDYKAPHRLPEIARMLEDKGLDFDWHLVGEGPLLEECKKSAAANRVEHRFHIHGSLPFSELEAIRSQSDIMVHNAVIAPDGGRECLGVVLMEGGLEGLPVVSCRVGGIPEVIEEGKTGFMVDSGDLAAMVDRIMRLARDANLRFEMGLAAAEHVRNSFDSVTLAAQMKCVYDTVGQRYSEHRNETTAAHPS